MVLRIGDNERKELMDGDTVAVVYMNGKTETIDIKSVRFIYLNPEQVSSVKIIEKEK